MLRPGDLDARPPLARVDVPYNQQQLGGVLGGALVKDKMFYFGSYEYRRERSEVAITSPAATEPSVKTPADEHQAHVRMDYRFDDRNSLALRYNMVRWQKDNEAGGLSLPGTGFIWDNNVDTVHAMFTTVKSSRFLNEVRAQYSRYTDSRAAKVNAVNITRTNYSVSGGNDQGTWGVIPETTYDLSDTVSLWLGKHTMKLGASITYDVTKQLFQPLQNGVYTFNGNPAQFPNPSQYRQSFALVPEAALMYPKATVVSGFFQEDWRALPNLTLNLQLAAALGLMLGVGLAFFLEYLDDTMQRPDDMERIAHLPVLGVIPLVKPKKADRNVALAMQSHLDARSTFAEAYRSVRTALQFSTREGAPRQLVVTSTAAQEGKSTTALALAINFAQAGQSVLLIDADTQGQAGKSLGVSLASDQRSV